MTLKELTAHWRLLQRLQESEETLRSLRETIAPAGQILTGMPHTPGVRDRVGDLAAEIVDMEADIEHLREMSNTEERIILDFISEIQDPCTKLIFRLRFIRGLTWGEIAGIIGNYSTEKSVKQACYRYIENSALHDETV